MSANLDGIDNAAFGTNSSSSNLHGSNNASFGVFSLQSSTGDSDTCMGENCLGNNTSGTANTAMGLAAGVTETSANSNVSGSQNTWIGANSGPGTTTQLSNTCALGYKSHPTQNNQCTIGSNTTTLATLYGAMQWPSYTTAGTLQTDASGNVSSTGKLAAFGSFRKHRWVICCFRRYGSRNGHDHWGDSGYALLCRSI